MQCRKRLFLLYKICFAPLGVKELHAEYLAIGDHQNAVKYVIGLAMPDRLCGLTFPIFQKLLKGVLL